METTLAQLKTQIDELEKRIKALSNQVTTQGYMTGLKTCLENIQSLFTTYQEQLNKHLEDYKTHTDAYDLHIADYEQIAQTVESIQSQISSISSTLSGLSNVSGDIEDIKGDINTINTALSALDGVTQDISSLESAVATINGTLSGLSDFSTDISNLKSDVEEINSTLSSIGGVTTDIESLQNDIDSINSTLSGMSTVSQDIEDIEDDITVINSNISSLSSSIGDLQDADTLLSSRITTLENSSSSGSGGQTGGDGTETTTKQMVWQKDSTWGYVHQPDSSNYSTPKCQFACEPNTRVVLSFNIDGSVITESSASMEKIVSFYVNGVKVRDFHFNSSPPDFQFSCTYNFIPQRPYNYFSVYVWVGQLHRVKSYTLSVEGMNVQILNKDLPLKIGCFNDHYYVLRKDNSNNSIYYAIMEKDSLTAATSSMTEVKYTKLPCGLAYAALVPTTEVVDGLVQFDTGYTNQFKIVGVDGTKDHRIVILTYENNQWEIYAKFDSLNTTSAEFIYGGVGKPSDITVPDFTPNGDVVWCVDVDGWVAVVGGGCESYQTYFSLNGEDLYESRFRMGTVVQNINNKIGQPSAFHGYVVLDTTTMKNLYLPDYLSDYSVELPEGGNVTAYYQTDGSINVYINRGIDVYKYVLQKNSSGQYELSSTVTKIENITRYEELYDGSCIVYRDMDWEIKFY